MKITLNIPNQLTLLRVICVPFFIVSVLYLETGQDYLRYVPAIIFCIAVVTDGLDGFFARILDQKTKLGTWLDPIADKMLLVSAFVLLGLTKIPFLKLPIWLWVTVLSRDFIILLGVVIIHMLKGKIHVAPTFLGKITTVLQMLVIVTRLLGFSYHVDILWIAAAIFTAITCMDYIFKGIKQVNE